LFVTKSRDDEKRIFPHPNSGDEVRDDESGEKDRLPIHAREVGFDVVPHQRGADENEPGKYAGRRSRHRYTQSERGFVLRHEILRHALARDINPMRGPGYCGRYRGQMTKPHDAPQPRLYRPVTGSILHWGPTVECTRGVAG